MLLAVSTTRAAVALVIATATVTQASQICSGTTTITTAPSGCATYTGDIVVATGFAGTLSLDGLEKIEGSLVIENVTRITTISSDSLQSITNSLFLANLTILSTFNFTQLQSVSWLTLAGLPYNQALSFLQTLEELSVLDIQNTQIGDLEGFNIQTIDQVLIANNPFMTSLNLQPSTLTTSLTVQANARDLAVSMPNLANAYNMTFRNCSSISTPSLTTVNGSLGLYSNYITAFNGAPLLQSMGGSLTFDSNFAMKEVSLPELKTIAGGFQVTNNLALRSLDEFYSLANAYGAVDLQGNFNK